MLNITILYTVGLALLKSLGLYTALSIVPVGLALYCILMIVQAFVTMLIQVVVITTLLLPGSELINSYHLPLNSRTSVEDYREYPDYETPVLPAPKYQNNNPSYKSEVSPEQVVHSIRRSKEEIQSVVVDKLHVVDNWPDPSRQLGQVSGVAIDIDGNVVVFHRGDRIWTGDTFDLNNIYNKRGRGPIPQNTLVVYRASNGSVLKEWGDHLFYMPHGLTIDFENNVWVTDVALHQVLKFAANSGAGSHPLMTLGVAFEPGNDNYHFCKPTDVAIMRNGDFFVSDGYCNSRVIKYSKSGQHLMQWGRSTYQSAVQGKALLPYEFFIPHSLALAEDKNMLCAADRENGRIQCFNCHNGSFVMQLHSPRLGSRLFSVAYAGVQGGLLYILNGPELTKLGGGGAKGFVVSLASNSIIEEFAPNENGFTNPHDFAVSPDGKDVYIVELNPYLVWKFHRGNLTSSIDVKPNRPVEISPHSVPVQGPRVSPLNQTKTTKEPDVSTPQPSTSVPTIISIIIVASALGSIVLAVAIIRMKKRGKENIYSDEHTARYTKLIE